ncbi:hypothetical protein LTR37_019260 [Vermiconidia calcicola]|uniref:Uncharacterized protein n=1 Tax=Vermiconidia calcicola TaxID=1690605 RepID=A0ACC3MEL1_9PEZI|nr:hypothetical protein LTR37_019260 [Vermiconidia calcicola]
MAFFHFLLVLLLSLFATAAPTVDIAGLSTSAEKSLNPRQIVADGTFVNCCTNCGGAYDYTTFWTVFDDFCTWAGNGMELWTSQEYYTDTYYCKSDPCIHLLVQYTCGSPRVSSLDYWGCMGHFSFAIEPEDNCGGPPYPGARVESPDHCWIFQATADTFATSSAVSNIALECDDSGRWCHLPGSDNATLPVPEHEWGSTIRPSLS